MLSVILPNTPGAEHLTSGEVERRTTSFNSRRALLKSNPSLFISRTRLSIRQIPVFVTDGMIKRLALHAVHEFEAEVEKGERKGLSADELVVRNKGDGGEDGNDGDSKRREKKGKKGGCKTSQDCATVGTSRRCYRQGTE